MDWKEIEATESYKALPPEEKVKVGQRYFDKRIKGTANFQALPEPERAKIYTRLGIQGVTAGQGTTQPIESVSELPPKPTVFEKVKQQAREMVEPPFQQAQEQLRALGYPESMVGTVQPLSDLQGRQPVTSPYSAGTVALPEISKLPPRPPQITLPPDVQRQFEIEEMLSPHTSLRKMAGAAGMLPGLQPVPEGYLAQNFPAEYSAGKLLGYVGAGQVAGPLAKLLPIGPMAQYAASRALTFGGKKAVDQLLRAKAGTIEPTMKELVLKPAVDAGFGAALAPLYSLPEVGQRAVTTGVVRALWNMAGTKLQKGEVSKADMANALTSGFIFAAMEAVIDPTHHWTEKELARKDLEEAFKRNDFESVVNFTKKYPQTVGKVLDAVRQKWPEDYEIFKERIKVIDVTPFNAAPPPPPQQNFGVKLLPQGIRENVPGMVGTEPVQTFNLGLQTVDPSAIHATIAQKYPILASYPPDIQEGMVSRIMAMYSKGVPIDEAIQYEADQPQYPPALPKPQKGGGILPGKSTLPLVTPPPKPKVIGSEIFPPYNTPQPPAPIPIPQFPPALPRPQETPLLPERATTPLGTIITPPGIIGAREVYPEYKHQVPKEPKAKKGKQKLSELVTPPVPPAPIPPVPAEAKVTPAPPAEVKPPAEVTALTESQKQFIQNKVKGMSRDEVLKAYADNTPVSKYARGLVEKGQEIKDLVGKKETGRQKYFKGVTIGKDELKFKLEGQKKGNGAEFAYTPFVINGVEYLAVESKRGGWNRGYEYSVLDPTGVVVQGFHNKKTGQNTALNLDVKNRKELIYKFTTRAEDPDNEIRDSYFIESQPEPAEPKGQKIEDVIKPAEKPQEIKDVVSGKKVVKPIRINTELTGAYSGQENFTTYAKDKDDNFLGKIDYVIYGDKLSISMIEVEEPYRRQKVATELMNQVKAENPNVEIDWGDYATKEGEAFIGSIESKAPPKPQPLSELVAKKEPWEMTKAEALKANYWMLPDPETFGDEAIKALSEYAPVSADMLSQERAKRINDILESHKKDVELALAEGKPVPPEVLADYPDLQPKAAQPQKVAELVEKKSAETKGAKGLDVKNLNEDDIRKAIEQTPRNVVLHPPSIDELVFYKTPDGEYKGVAIKWNSGTVGFVEKRTGDIDTAESNLEWYTNAKSFKSVKKSIVSIKETLPKEGKQPLKEVVEGKPKAQKIKEIIKPDHEGPPFNFKTKSQSKLQAEEQRYADYLKGRFYKSYFKTEDEILDVTWGKLGVQYKVKDVATGEVRTHRTWIDAEKTYSKEAKTKPPSPPSPEESKAKGKESKSLLESHRDMLQRMYKTEVTPDEFKQAFESILSSEKAIKEELSTMTREQLLKLMGGSRQYMFKNDKKDSLVKSAYDDMVDDFTLGKGYSYSMTGGGSSKEASIRKMVEATTEQDLKEFAERVAKNTEEYKKRLEGYKKALQNPETYEEFSIFVKHKGEDKLTPEQRVKWDELQAERQQEKAQGELEKKAVVRKVDLGDVNMSVHETKHTQKGHDLFVVQLDQRVERDVYNDLNRKAKQLGGYYSSYTKGGAIAGFQFKDKESAQKFMSLKEEDVSRLDILEAKKEAKVDKAVERFRDMADRMEEKANKVLEADRQVNTARRARMAAGVEDDARNQIAFAKTMRNLAAAIERGDAKHLSGITSATQIETLNSALAKAKYDAIQKNKEGRFEEVRHRPAKIEDVEFAQYPYPRFNTEGLQGDMLALKEKPGFKQIAERLNKAAVASGQLTTISDPSLIEDLRKIAAMTPSTYPGNKFDRYGVSSYKEKLVNYDRIQKAGLVTEAQFRAALREYIQYKDVAPKEDHIKKAERALIGKKIEGFFPTPTHLAERMVDLADIKPGDRVLEPSAGKGNIADAIKEAGVNPDVLEVYTPLVDILKAKGHNWVGYNFEQFNPDKPYDAIVMNPPFEKGQDIDHVKRAYDMLKPDGRLIAIMGEGAFFRGDKKATEFREWLDKVGGDSEKLPEGTFKESGTGVATRLVTITKSELSSLLASETGSLNLSKFFPKKQPPKVTRIEDLLKAEAAKPPIAKPEAPKGPQQLSSFFGQPVRGAKYPMGEEVPKRLPGTESNNVQRKAAHIMASNAGLTEEQYRDLAEKTIGVRSITEMSEDEANKFINALDEHLSAKENKILNRPGIPFKQKSRVISLQRARATQIGQGIGDPKYIGLVAKTKSILDDIGNVPPGDNKPLENLPEELRSYDDTNLWDPLRNIRFVARKNDTAYDLYKMARQASFDYTAMKLKFWREAHDVANGLKLHKKDLAAVSLWREHMPGAPTQLSEKQAKWNDWLTKQYGLHPGDALHGLFNVEKFVPGGYNPRMQNDVMLTLDEMVLNNAFGAPQNVPKEVSEWFKKERTGNLQDRKLDSLELYKKYVATGSKSLYFSPEMLKTYREGLKQLPSGMRRMMESYLYRMLGYPDPGDVALASTLNKMAKAFNIKHDLTEEDIQKGARIMIDLAYVRGMGLRPKTFLKNLTQTINNTIPELGATFTARGLATMLYKGFKGPQEAGIFLEFAPELYKELGEDVTNWDKFRDYSLVSISLSDKMNRAIVFYGASQKFDMWAKGYNKHKDIGRFMHRIEADKFHRLVKKDIVAALQKGDIKLARKLYIEELVGKTQYLYNKEDSPIFTRSLAGKLTWQYHTWPMNYAELLVDDAANHNWKAWARRMIMAAALFYSAKHMNDKTKKLLKQSLLFGPYQRGMGIDFIVPAIEPIVDILAAGTWPIRNWDKFSTQKWGKYAKGKGEKLLPMAAKEIHQATKSQKLEDLIK